MKRKNLFGILLLLIASAVLECRGKALSTVTITDSAGRKVTVSKPVLRIVTLSSDSAEAVSALGAKDKIVGVSKYTAEKEFWRELLGDKEVVGSCFSPNYEKIASLLPDIVIAYVKWTEDLERKLKPFNIKVVRLDFYKQKTLPLEIEKLGKILGKVEQAKKLIGFLDKYENIIKKRVEEIKPSSRVQVYVEGYQKWHTGAKGSGWHQQVTLAGGENLAAGFTISYPEVSAEWVAEENPDVIVKAVSGTKGIFGYKVDNTTQALALRDEIAKRKGLSEVKAVSIYLLSPEVFSSCRYIVAVAYLARNFYPQKFQDLNPALILKNYMETFLGVEYKGTWTYPPLESNK